MWEKARGASRSFARTMSALGTSSSAHCRYASGLTRGHKMAARAVRLRLRSTTPVWGWGRSRAARRPCAQRWSPRPARWRDRAEHRGARPIHRHRWLRLLRSHHAGGLRARAGALLRRQRHAGHGRRLADPGECAVAAYWAAIQKNEHAARVLVELRRGVEERREMIRSGAFDRLKAAAAAAEHQGGSRHAS